jgi:hypothetical protein
VRKASKASASFLKKRRPAWGSKKLLFIVGVDAVGAKARSKSKFFCFFFFKKRSACLSLLCSIALGPGDKAWMPAFAGMTFGGLGT